MNSIRPIYTLAGIGELLWDTLAEGKRLGGAPANVALHAHALGGRAQIVSAIGRDQEGREILDMLSSKKIGTDFILLNDHPTGWVDVKIGENGLPTYVIHENVAWDYLPFPPPMQALAQRCDAVCFGSLAQRNAVSRNTIQHFVCLTQPSCLRVFDINLRGDYYSREIIEYSLRIANVFKLNKEELDVLSEMFGLPRSPEAALRALLDRYDLELVALTQGQDGSLMMDRRASSFCPGIAVEVKDTVGAGDSFTATMIMGFLHGAPLENVNRLAGKIAAYVCSQSGATPSLPAELIAEFEQMITAPMPRPRDKCIQKT